jgi:hypothetical protein
LQRFIKNPALDAGSRPPARADSRAAGQRLAARFLLDEIYYPLNIVIPIVTAQRIPNEIAMA